MPSSPAKCPAPHGSSPTATSATTMRSTPLSCRLMEIVAASAASLSSAQLAGFPKMVSTPEIRVDCTDETKFQVVARVAAQFKKTHNVIDVDGVRVLFGEGWGLLSAASNTQPVLVMRFEAPNRKKCSRAIAMRSNPLSSKLKETYKVRNDLAEN